MTNYFKLRSGRDCNGSRMSRADEVDTPEWASEIAARVKRICRKPPAHIDWDAFVFFNEDSVEDTARAWREALAQVGGDKRRIHIARVAPVHGPWTWVLEIGEVYPDPAEMAS